MTPTQREHVRLVRRGFQLYMGGDVEGLLELYHPEVHVTAQEWMNAGPFHGHEGFMEWTRLWNEAWETFEFDVRDVVPVGDRHVVAAVLVKGRGAGSGIEVEQLAGWVVEIRDGQAAYVEVTTAVDGAFAVARERETGDA